MRSLLLALLLGSTAVACAQQQPDLADQRQAMQKLNFLVGKWTGDATVSHGPGEPIKIIQTEVVQYKLDGLVLLIEGTGRDEGGKAVFTALATVSYDDENFTYHFRAYNGGRYLDTELKVLPHGFTWAYNVGPAKITNAMHLTEKGEWAEVTEAAVGSAPPRKSVDMLLHLQP
ncbi:MAG TPA: hypothetical protein VK627_10880 [Edaphobacter sp.]|nr:hypothetical protein [Edaphobacter sp.]